MAVVMIMAALTIHIKAYFMKKLRLEGNIAKVRIF